jgi:hypothetical protein
VVVAEAAVAVLAALAAEVLVAVVQVGIGSIKIVIKSKIKEAVSKVK